MTQFIYARLSVRTVWKVTCTFFIFGKFCCELHMASTKRVRCTVIVVVVKYVIKFHGLNTFTITIV